MKKLLLPCLLAALLFAGFESAAQQRVKKTVFQGFWWDYWNSNFPNGWANYLAEMAPRLRAAGFDAIWIPPVYKNSSTNDVGYGPFDMYDLGDKYQKGGDVVKTKTRVGTKDELLRMIAVMHANGIEVIQDVVLNHNNGAGTRTGVGGQDPETNYSMVTNNGYKNFRFTSFSTPLINDSQIDYFSRNGRWHKNYTNFHPNPGDNCTTGDICAPYFGPDISYSPLAYGKSSNIPDTGYAVFGNIKRPFINSPQYNEYMRNNGRDWLGWFKKQTGSDGWRWDAVKHFPVNIQEDYIYHSKYGIPDFAKGGQDMFCVGEWIGDATALDAYVNSVKTGLTPDNVPDEKHTGTFDFSLRGYGPNGGIYSMVLSQGGYNMQNLPGEQQGERYMVYPSGKIVHRTVPFVNSHDTYRPRLDNNGNYLNNLGVDSGWNVNDELGGNGKHIDPREPRLAAAYATVCSIDGNPDFFIEDFFDIGTTGKRYTHLPSNTTDLPARTDLVNILQSHQRLAFKNGDYRVLTSLTGTDAPFYQKGSSGDHLIIERAGQAIIGITDAYGAVADNTQDQEVYVTADASWVGKQLYDWSGAHGIQTTQVFADRRVLIKTAPAGHVISGANGHGYSVWAPAPTGVTITSVSDLYNYLATYTPSRSPETTQEWEMADDLGDSHCNSLGQGGRLPDSSTQQRIAGKIFVEAFKPVTYKVYPEVDGKSIAVQFWKQTGTVIHENTNVATSANPLSGTFTPNYTGWITVKVRNSTDTQAGQKVWVNVTYTAPTVVNTRDSAMMPETKASIWSGWKKTSDFFDCGNWEEGKIPTNNSTVVVPKFAEVFPILKTDLTVKDLYVQKGAFMKVDSATLGITGYVDTAGTLDATTAYIEFKGASTQVLGGSYFLNRTIRGLIVNNPATVAFTNLLNITEVLQVKTGTFYMSNSNYVVLKSSATQTARVAQSASTGGYIDARVVVERYISPRKAWRLLAAPFTTSETIHASWQENASSYTANPNPGYGTHITGGTASNGYDEPPVFEPSLLKWDYQMQMFQMVDSTNKSLSSESGYMMLVKGDRGIDITNPNTAPTATVLRATGLIKQGDQPAVRIGADSLTLIGNPYPSPIDFTRINRTNVPDRFFLFDPNRGERGAFVLFEGPTYVPMNGAGYYTDSNTLIQSSEAFMVEGGNIAGTISINESSKSSSDKNVFRAGGINDVNVKVNLNYAGGTPPLLLDNTMVRFDNTYSAAVNAEDVGKPRNIDENISILRDSKELTVERRPMVTKLDTVFLIIDNMKQRSYSLDLFTTNLPDSIAAWVEDLYLNTTTPINPAAPTTINFSITNNAGSSAPGRFRIIFRNNNSLPLNYTGINAYQKDAGVQVDWKVSSETNVHHYEVEKSAKGETYNKAASVNAKANNNSSVKYSWYDHSPYKGNNYYRIRAVDKNGVIKLSSVAKVFLGNGNGEILVYPNPVKGKSISVQFNSIAAGKYTMSLFNPTGQKVSSRVVEHAGASGTYSLSVPTGTAKGIYQLRLVSDQINNTIEIVVE